VQFLGVGVAELPRAYVATKGEIAEQLKSQQNGTGHLALREDYKRDHPKSKYSDKIPTKWQFSKSRLTEKMKARRLQKQKKSKNRK
jgi:hypothetical protein